MAYKRNVMMSGNLTILKHFSESCFSFFLSIIDTIFSIFLTISLCCASHMFVLSQLLRGDDIKHEQ
jgi:hypothetical protein